MGLDGTRPPITHRGAHTEPRWGRRAIKSLSPKQLFLVGRPNLDEDLWLLWLAALFPLFSIALSLYLKVVTPGLYRYLIREDGIVEWATALAFLAAGGFAGLLALRLWRDRRAVLAVMYLGLAIGMVFAMVEEISWGQRILDLETPDEFVEHSTKEEINLHNLKAFPLGLAFIAVGFYGAFARMLVPHSVRRRFPWEVELLTPRLVISSYFLVTFAIYTYFEYIYYTVMQPLGIDIRREYQWDDHFIIGKDQEPVELLLAIGFLLFVCNNWQLHKAREALDSDQR